MNLFEYLENKPLYYDEIDYTRMSRVYEKIKASIKIPKIVHIIGTNGKGTTGRFLASALHNIGFRVGHYTSPHIIEFNERIWLEGQNVSVSMLDDAHKKLQSLLSNEDASSLSYFEYTTLIAVLMYQDCDFVVMEAGLGGEHDATSVFENILTLITPIGYDHQAFLGSTIDDIALTKLSAIQKSAILASQPYTKVYEVADCIAKEKNLVIYKAHDLLDEEDKKNIKLISQNLSLAPYLTQNLSLSVAALKFLKIKYGINDFRDSLLFGRLSKIAPNVTVDVGHNSLAAKSIVESLKGSYVLVYNSYSDKNYKDILNILKPIIKRVEIIDIADNKRVEKREFIERTLDELSIKHSSFMSINDEDEYLVFGSFSVVEAFLKVIDE